jgi:hypothetical protein
MSNIFATANGFPASEAGSACDEAKSRLTARVLAGGTT